MDDRAEDDAGGLTVTELAERSTVCASAPPLSPDTLRAWLVGQQLAVVDEHGRLEPTARAFELGGALS